MSTPFKLKSGNKPDKPGFFGTFAPVIDRIIKKAKKLFSIRSKEDALKWMGFKK